MALVLLGATGFIGYLPVPVLTAIVIAATTDTACVFPSYCSFIDVLDILPFTGQHPTHAAAIFPIAQARIS